MAKTIAVADSAFLMAAVVVGVNAHSVARHGNEATAIHDCLNQNGAYMTFKATRDPGRFYQLCEVEKGVWGMRAIICEAGRAAQHVTSFVPKSGALGEVMNYMRQFSTPFKQALPCE